MAAVINNFGGFYSTELYFHELRRSGARVHAPCVNNSDVLTSINCRDVYMGFVHIKSLENATIDTIVNERSRHGAFLNLHDFIERTGTGPEHVNILIRIGAFRFTGKNKKELLWEANFLHKRVKKTVGVAAIPFEDELKTYKLPALHQTALEDALDGIELFGFPLCDPFSLIDFERSRLV